MALKRSKNYGFKRKIIGVDLFSGIGGLSQGAQMAGIDVQFAVEKDVFAANAYKLNHPKVIVLNKDIKEVYGKDLLVQQTKVSPIVLFGGPPCQGYSTSNHKMPLLQ